MSVIGSVFARVMPALGRWLLPGAAGAVLALGAGFAAGKTYQGWRAGAEIAEAKTALVKAQRAHQEDLRRNAEAASIALYVAQQRGDVLTRRLVESTRRARNLQEDLDVALSAATTGRPCIDEPALRLLDGSPGLRVALPEPAGGAARADAARVATDSDLARWASRAGRQYDECRHRLDALIDWHTTVTSNPNPQQE